MSRGSGRLRGIWELAPPLAWAFIVVCVIALSVLLPIAANREKVAGAGTGAVESPPTGAADTAPSLTELRADGDLSIYYIGDSLTDGYNASDQDQGFRPVLTRTLATEGVATEAADYKAGATLQDVMGVATLPPTVDVAVIELGTNNVAQDNADELAGFQAAYQQLVDQLDAASQRLVCLGVYRTGGTADQLDKTIQDICQPVGTFLPIQDLYRNKAFVTPDGAAGYPRGGDGGHPNDAGHAEIARRIQGALTGD